MDVIFYKQKASFASADSKYFYVSYEMTMDNFPPLGLPIFIGDINLGSIDGMEYDIVDNILKIYLDGKIKTEDDLKTFLELEFELV